MSLAQPDNIVYSMGGGGGGSSSSSCAREPPAGIHVPARLRVVVALPGELAHSGVAQPDVDADQGGLHILEPALQAVANTQHPISTRQHRNMQGMAGSRV